jgi:hypothetical protein
LIVENVLHLILGIPAVCSGGLFPAGIEIAKMWYAKRTSFTFYDLFFPPLNMLICFRPMFDVADNCTLSSELEGVDMICSSSRYLHLVSFCLFSSVLEFLESLLLECSDCVLQDGAGNICSVDC